MELGVVLGKGVDEEGIEDRAYRIHYNKGQNRTDRFAGVRRLPKAVSWSHLANCTEAHMIQLLTQGSVSSHL